MSQKKKLLDIKKLNKKYGANKILENIDFSLLEGESISIIGSSGIGKTTFLNILLGIDKDFKAEKFEFAKNIATVFQEDRLLDWYSIYENIKVVNKSISDEKIFEILNVMNLLEYKDYYPKALSGGMKQRASIARALAFDSKLIVMDEPLKSTDIILKSSIIKYIKEKLKKENKGLILITHDINDAYELSDKIYILANSPAKFIKEFDLTTNKEKVIKEIEDYINMNKDKMIKVAGHELLARLGKKRLRPGGVEATNWLIENASFNENLKVLEVACNMGTTLIEIVKKYNCEVTGVDAKKEVLDIAKENIKKENIENKVKLINADARVLPFDDESFDIVINEAMLTMLNNTDKQKAMNEYYRVLKKGGLLLTHDINLRNEDPEILKRLRLAINISATPLKEETWVKMLKEAGFSEIKTKTNPMTLMSEEGMKKDEGEKGMQDILEKAKKDPNFAQFMEMKEFFKKNRENMYYIAVVSKK